MRRGFSVGPGRPRGIDREPRRHAGRLPPSGPPRRPESRRRPRRGPGRADGRFASGSGRVVPAGVDVDVDGSGRAHHPGLRPPSPSKYDSIATYRGSVRRQDRAAVRGRCRRRRRLRRARRVRPRTMWRSSARAVQAAPQSSMRDGAQLDLATGLVRDGGAASEGERGSRIPTEGRDVGRGMRGRGEPFDLDADAAGA